MDWWMWVLIALGLIVTELFVPTGFIFLLVGAAFLCTGIIVALGVTSPTWLPWAICVVLFVAFVTLLRRPLMRIFGFDAPSPYNEMTSEEIIINEPISPGDVGQGELRGTVWKVKNIGSSALSTGQRCRVARVDGLTVEVKG